jgi:hypothetical protein
MITRAISAIFLLSLVALMIPAAAIADTIQLNSDLWNEENNRTGTNSKILWPYPLDDSGHGWQPNGADYFWISYADTGYPPGAPPPDWPSDVPNPIVLPWPEEPTAVFYETFILPYTINTGAVTVWADDTARVYLGRKRESSGDYHWKLLWDANPIQDSFCADGKIGCEPGEGLNINFNGLHLWAGDYRLRIDAYQRNDGPFGIMYGGSIESQPVPELSSLFMLATGLAAVCLALRRAGTQNAA